MWKLPVTTKHLLPTISKQRTSRRTPKTRKDKTLNVRPLVTPLVLHPTMKSILVFWSDAVWVDSVESANVVWLSKSSGERRIEVQLFAVI